VLVVAAAAAGLLVVAAAAAGLAARLAAVVMMTAAYCCCLTASAPAAASAAYWEFSGFQALARPPGSAAAADGQQWFCWEQRKQLLLLLLLLLVLVVPQIDDLQQHPLLSTIPTLSPLFLAGTLIHPMRLHLHRLLVSNLAAAVPAAAPDLLTADLAAAHCDLRHQPGTRYTCRVWEGRNFRLRQAIACIYSSFSHTAYPAAVLQFSGPAWQR
jgi:hypothetical protein